MSVPKAVLIVDDEESMRETLGDILESRGYAVAKAATGEAAVELCSNNAYDAVLMDVRMPGLDGVEAFHRIRRHREGARVILMSAYTTDSLKDAALDGGAIAFLTKPLNIEAVVRLIGEVKETAILVVEDDTNEAELMSRVLKAQGYWVRAARTPPDALELAEQVRFDIIFIDMRLPAMNGLELYLAIRKITPSAVAIMVTGGEQEFEDLAREAVRRTAYTLIRKPLDMDEIIVLLERITGQQMSNALRKPPL
jgi:DNA-binding NtrC family response regulator